MAQIVDGNKIAQEILADLKNKVVKLKSAGIVPRLAVFMVGRNPASRIYISKKQQAGELISIKVEVKSYPDDVSQEKLTEEIKRANAGGSISGIIVQLPLPSHLDKQLILDAVDPELDVDCLTTLNKEKLSAGQKVLFVPPTPAAVLKILQYYDIDLKSAHVLLVGRGDLVGKPLAAILKEQKIDFDLAHSQTQNLAELASRADIIITGVGKPGLIRGEMIKEGAVVIDAGTAGSESGDVRGDVDFESASRKARLISPMPGGVGPVTVAMLLNNVVDSALS